MKNAVKNSCFPKGFTLIELLVVVLIIGILTAVAVPQYQIAVGKSKMLSALPLMRSILNAQQSYILANSTGTFNVNEIDIHFPYTKITGTSSTYSRRYHLDNQQYFIIYSAANRIIYAKHKKNDESSLEYAISLYKDGQGDCTFYNTTWEKICKSLSNSKLREDSTKTYDFSF